MQIWISWQQTLLFVGPDAQTGSLGSQKGDTATVTLSLTPTAWDKTWQGKNLHCLKFLPQSWWHGFIFFSYSISSPTENSPI